MAVEPSKENLGGRVSEEVRIPCSNTYPFSGLGEKKYNQPGVWQMKI